MQTQTGMLAQIIHEDRVRGYEDPSWTHRSEMTRTTAQASSPRKLFTRSILCFGRPTGSGPILARSAF
jgi:hypothetical protein